MTGLQAIQDLLAKEQQRQEADLRDLGNIVSMLKNLELKFDEKIDAINPKSQFRLLSIKNVESLIPFKSKWIDERVADGSFPKPKLLGSKKIWYQKDVERWIQENMDEIEH